MRDVARGHPCSHGGSDQAQRATEADGPEWAHVAYGRERRRICADPQGRQIRGSIVLVNGAAHVNKLAATAERNADSLEVRLDERTSSAEETRVLGIEVGDFVYLDTRTEHGAAGFVRSRFLDDKACVAAKLAALKAMRDNGITPAQRTTFHFPAFTRKSGTAAPTASRRT